MAYEFKRLSDVEVVDTPADTANVLIEEDGVIKKAPKTAVGGAANNDEVDFEFTISDIESLSADNVLVTGGSIDNIIQRIRNGEIPKVRVIVDDGLGKDPVNTSGYAGANTNVLCSWYGGEFGFEFNVGVRFFHCVYFNEFGEFTSSDVNSLW